MGTLNSSQSNPPDDSSHSDIEGWQTFFERLCAFQISLYSHTDMHQRLETLVCVGRDIIGSDDVSIVLWNSVEMRFERGASTTVLGKRLPSLIRQTGGASRWVIDNKTPIIVESPESAPFACGEILDNVQIKAYVGVPILSDNEAFGVLYASYFESRPINKVELAKLEQLALVAAVSIKYAQHLQYLETENKLLSQTISRGMQNLVQPLSLVMGFSDLLAEDIASLSPMNEIAFEAIQRSHNRLSHIITETLNFENLIFSYKLDPVPVSLNYVAITARNALKGISEKAKFNIEIIEDNSIPPILGDAYLLVESLKELVENGARYSSKNQGVTIATHNLPEHVMISIKDNGEGLMQDQISQIFEPFVRFSLTPSPIHLGLGLSYVKVITQMHGGYIEVHSQAGEGSEFQLYFPK